VEVHSGVGLRDRHELLAVVLQVSLSWCVVAHLDLVISFVCEMIA
jgi:hypothetical protein